MEQPVGNLEQGSSSSPRRAPDSLLRAGEELRTMTTCLSFHPPSSLTRTQLPLEWSLLGSVLLQVVCRPGKQRGHRGACGLGGGLRTSTLAR